MKKLLKKIIKNLGWHLCKFNIVYVPSYQTVRALKAHNINVVFDVGANIGQFASELRMYGYEGKIISFEPLSQAHSELVNRAKYDKNWIVHPRSALGNSINNIEINVSYNSVSSSILPMLISHENSAPNSKYIRKESVPLVTFDSVYKMYCSPKDNVFLKIDTQGYEWSVLDGAELHLSNCKGVLLELSLLPLYEGQKLWEDLIGRLRITNHDLFAIQPGFTDQLTGQTLQIDGLFFKSHN